jgi:predicted nucleic acid-binding protein
VTPAPRPRRGLIFDAGMLIALERGSRQQWARLRAAQREGIVPVIPAPVVTQVWRSARQANLGRALDACAVQPVDEDLAREAGELCASAGTSDTVDAIVVASAARRGSVIATSDLVDLARLAACTDDVELSPV